MTNLACNDGLTAKRGRRMVNDNKPLKNGLPARYAEDAHRQCGLWTAVARLTRVSGSKILSIATSDRHSQWLTRVRGQEALHFALLACSLPAACAEILM
jgi:hypothetical protein